METRLNRRSVLRAALLPAGAWAAAWVRAAAEPPLPAPLAGQFEDRGRGRVLPWLLRLPATPGPWPLVLHSHGLGGSREGGALWGTAWAESGIAVLHLQHPGSDTETLRAGLLKLRAAASAEQLRARVDDVHFMLDELARRSAEGPWAQLRAEAIGLSGHSFGAHTVQAIAGQRFPPVAARWLGGARWADERPRAFIAFSPAPPDSNFTVQQAFGAITRPFLVCTGSADTDPFGKYASGDPRATVYEGLPPGRRGLLWLEGADHMSFGGGAPLQRPLPGRTALARQLEGAQQALVARLSALWWRWQLLGDEAAQAALKPPEGLGPQDRFVLG